MKYYNKSMNRKYIFFNPRVVLLKVHKGKKANTDLSAITISFEVEPQLHDVIVELRAKAFLVRVLPLSINDFEGYVLVGRSSSEAQNGEVTVVLTRRDRVLWRRTLVDQIRIKDVELVALNDFGWWVVHVVVSLVILVPFETSVNAVEVTRFTRSVLV